VTVSVEVADGVGLGRIEPALQQMATAVLEAERISGSVVIAFVDEDAIRELNERYRGIDQPTDVLSFRYADEAAGEADMPGEPAGPGTAPEIGELVVCPAVVARYAAEEKAAGNRQFGWTLIHGLLHLAGYDHEADTGQMRAREQQLLASLAPLVAELPTLGIET
jgi:rRNA maturation RNase YbeY